MENLYSACWNHSIWSPQGRGAFGSHGQWFQLQWPESQARHHIVAKELVPVVMAIALWGAQWQATTVLLRSDNAAVVASLTAGSAKNALLMHQLRCFHFFLAYFDIQLMARHLAGTDNMAADAGPAMEGGPEGPWPTQFSSDCCLLLELVSHPLYASVYSTRSWAWLDTQFHLIRDFSGRPRPRI